VASKPGVAQHRHGDGSSVAELDPVGGVVGKDVDPHHLGRQLLHAGVEARALALLGARPLQGGDGSGAAQEPPVRGAAAQDGARALLREVHPRRGKAQDEVDEPVAVDVAVGGQRAVVVLGGGGAREDEGGGVDVAPSSRGSPVHHDGHGLGENGVDPGVALARRDRESHGNERLPFLAAAFRSGRERGSDHGKEEDDGERRARRT
jgi:hypothetical protein